MVFISRLFYPSHWINNSVYFCFTFVTQQYYESYKNLSFLHYRNYFSTNTGRPFEVFLKTNIIKEIQQQFLHAHLFKFHFPLHPKELQDKPFFLFTFTLSNFFKKKQKGRISSKDRGHFLYSHQSASKIMGANIGCWRTINP